MLEDKIVFAIYESELYGLISDHNTEREPSDWFVPDDAQIVSLRAYVQNGVCELIDNTLLREMVEDFIGYINATPAPTAEERV